MIPDASSQLRDFVEVTETRRVSRAYRSDEYRKMSAARYSRPLGQRPVLGILIRDESSQAEVADAVRIALSYVKTFDPTFESNESRSSSSFFPRCTSRTTDADRHWQSPPREHLARHAGRLPGEALPAQRHVGAVRGDRGQTRHYVVRNRRRHDEDAEERTVRTPVDEKLHWNELDNEKLQSTAAL